MGSEKNDTMDNSVIENNIQKEPNETKKSPVEHLARVWYCKNCRDVSLGNICHRCQKIAVQTEGMIAQYKLVAESLMNHQNNWREMLESMII